MLENSALLFLPCGGFRTLLTNFGILFQHIPVFRIPVWGSREPFWLTAWGSGRLLAAFVFLTWRLEPDPSETRYSAYMSFP